MNKNRIALLSTVGLLSASGLAACGSSSSTTASTTAAATAAASTATAGTAAASQTAPQGTPTGAPGMGTAATGTDAAKASAAATAKYPGTVDQVMKLADGSYVVHVITASGEKHVKVSKTFAVTGLDTGMGGRGAGDPGVGTAATGAAATKASAAATAKYPGTVEHVFKLADGSYAVHVITASGEKHVKVSKDFAVTGLDTSMPGRGAAPSGQAAPTTTTGTATT